MHTFFLLLLHETDLLHFLHSIISGTSFAVLPFPSRRSFQSPRSNQLAFEVFHSFALENSQEASRPSFLFVGIELERNFESASECRNRINCSQPASETCYPDNSLTKSALTRPKGVVSTSTPQSLVDSWHRRNLQILNWFRDRPERQRSIKDPIRTRSQAIEPYHLIPTHPFADYDQDAGSENTSLPPPNPRLRSRRTHDHYTVKFTLFDTRNSTRRPVARLSHMDSNKNHHRASLRSLTFAIILPSSTSIDPHGAP